MKNEKVNSEILTTDLRKTLKSMIKRELEGLPEYFETLEPKERLNIVCKLIPFVLPKVESVHTSEGEPAEAWYG